MIYKELLVTPSLPPFVGNQIQGPNGSKTFNASILEASKQINEEATKVLYGGNTFRTLYYDARTFTDFGEHIQGGSTPHLEAKLEELKENLGYPWFTDSLYDDIASLFDEDFELEYWLSDLTFPRFLRAIGPDNTALIKSFRFDLGSLPTARDRLPIYTEIVRQHMPNLEELTLSFANIGDYGSASKPGSYTYEEYGTDLTWHEREDLTTSFLECTFAFLYCLLAHVPSLTQLEIHGGGEYLDAMAQVLVSCKRRMMIPTEQMVGRCYLRMKAVLAAEDAQGMHGGLDAGQWLGMQVDLMARQDFVPVAHNNY